MKSTHLISTGTLCFIAMACSTAAQAPAGSAGATGSAAGSPNAGAGAPAAMAGTSAGGSGNAGGDTSMTAGAPGAGSGDGVAGATTAGAGGSTAGATSGGATSGGAAGSGTAGSGGKAGGGAAGSGMAGGSTGGGGTVDPTTFAGTWDGALLQYPCGSGSPNYDCNQPTPCTAVSGTNMNAPVITPAGNTPTTWVMKGTMGTNYNVKVHIEGVTEVSWYHGGTRSAGTASVDVGSTVPGAQSFAKDLFQVGGTGLTYADQGNGFDYNQYELDVTPPGGGTPSVYFLNAVIPAENPHISGKTQHLSFQIDEMPTILIPGGATVSLAVRDSNCVEIQNCGTQNNSQSCQQGARSVPLTGAMPAPPASWTGKVTSGAGGTLGGQFVHFDVVSVTVAP